MSFSINEPLRLSFWINEGTRNELKRRNVLCWKDFLPPASLKMCPSLLDSHPSAPGLPSEATAHRERHEAPVHSQLGRSWTATYSRAAEGS